MKVYIDVDERYPDYTIGEKPSWDGKDSIEISPELWERYRRALAEYDAVQNILGEMRP